MRTHMTEEISEKVELKNLMDKYDFLVQQIKTLEQINSDFINRIRELELESLNESVVSMELNSEGIHVSGLSDNNFNNAMEQQVDFD